MGGTGVAVGSTGTAVAGTGVAAPPVDPEGQAVRTIAAITITASRVSRLNRFIVFLLLSIGQAKTYRRQSAALRWGLGPVWVAWLEGARPSPIGGATSGKRWVEHHRVVWWVEL